MLAASVAAKLAPMLGRGKTVALEISTVLLIFTPFQKFFAFAILI